MRYALLDFIADFANWDASTIPEFLETSRSLTQNAHEALGGIPGTKPLVVDPFAGGGSIPLEALRVGCDTFSSDLNPIASLLNKVVIQYIPRYGNKLPEQVNKRGQWIKKEAIKELSHYYPNEPDDSIVIGYLWARTIKCEGPKCGVTVPIIKNQVISSRKDSEAAILIEYHNGNLKTKIVTGSKALKINGGTSKRSSVTCQACGFTTPRQQVAVQANRNGFGFHLLAVCLRDLNGKRVYRQPQSKDLEILDLVDKKLNNWQNMKFNDIPSIPNEELPYLRSIFNVRVYGIDKWYKLFHRRQLLSSLVFTSLVRKAAEKGSRLRANDSAVLSSSIPSVCRSREYSIDLHYSENIGDWRHVLQELPKRIHEWMPRLQQEGVVGADAIFACLGPALEIFSRYSQVEKTSGDVVTLREYLEHVWATVAKEALTMIFKDADSTGYEEDARLTAVWLWTISTGGNGNGKKEGELEKSTGYILEYDAARKIAQGFGAHLEKLNHLIEIKGDKARLLPVAERTRHLFGKDNPLTKKKHKKKTNQITLFETLDEIKQDHNWNIEGIPETGETTLDKVHQSMLLFATGRGEALKRFLAEEGTGKDSRFWQLAQALSALYSSLTDEKRWVDGVLARKKSLGF